MSDYFVPDDEFDPEFDPELDPDPDLEEEDDSDSAAFDQWEAHVFERAAQHGIDPSDIDRGDLAFLLTEVLERGFSPQVTEQVFEAFVADEFEDDGLDERGEPVVNDDPRWDQIERQRYGRPLTE